MPLTAPASGTAPGPAPVSGAPSSRLGYLPALDGLRAVAVGAVFLFHAGVVSGGFVGVDVFFVISGFLITGLALVEIEETGRLSLGGFWSRRARRLLPAIFVLCAAVVLHAAIVGDGAARRVGRDVVGALAYVSNWVQLGEGRAYFSRYEEPNLVEHTWSLAVEEQFYLVWPLLLVVVAAICRWRGAPLRRSVAGVAIVLGVASAVWAAWLTGQDVQLGRIYYGTDTRAIGFGAGAALACLIGRRATTGGRRFGVSGTLSGVVAALVLLVATLVLDGGERWLYGPGFALIALASLVVVLVCTGQGPIAAALSWRPLVVVGRMSYGVYLWHWPVIVVLNTERTGLTGLPLGVCWLLVTALCTAVSWALVERRVPRPIRQAPWRSVAYVVTAIALAASAALVVGREERSRLTIALPPRRAVVGADAATAAIGPPSIGSSDIAGPPDAEVATVDVVDVTDGSHVGDNGDQEVVDASVDTADVAHLTAPPDRPLRILVIGDSVAMSLAGRSDETVVVPGVGEVVVRNEARLACSLIREGRWADFGSWELEDNPECDRPDRFQDAVSSFAPDVTFVLFGWPGIGGGRRLDDGQMLSPCEPEFDDRWIAELSILVGDLGHETTVVVSNVAAPASADPALAVPASCLNATLSGLQVPVYDFAGWICPDISCPHSDPLRPDGVHFDVDDALRRALVTHFAIEALAGAGYRPDR